jgi:hypothetical protein
VGDQKGCFVIHLPLYNFALTFLPVPDRLFSARQAAMEFAVNRSRLSELMTPTLNGEGRSFLMSGKETAYAAGLANCYAG